jgi:hypothetical protein
MSLINLSKIPPVLSEDELLEKAKAEIQTLATQLYINASDLHAKLFKIFWERSNAVKLAEKFGADAGSIFQISSLLQQVFKLANPDYVYLIPPVGYTINDDGTFQEAKP